MYLRSLHSQAEMESKGIEGTTTQLPNVISPNARITPSLFTGNNYKDWSYSTRMAIGRAKRVEYIDASVKGPKQDDPKYSDWVTKNMLIITINWIINSTEEIIAASFKYCETAKELWDSIEASFS